MYLVQCGTAVPGRTALARGHSIGRGRALVLVCMDSTGKTLERTKREGVEPLRILVVDDSATSRKLAEYAFEGKPYHVFFAEDGRRALQMIGERNPDIVITGWLMPDLSGVDLCRLVRQMLQRKNIYLMLSDDQLRPRRYDKGQGIGSRLLPDKTAEVRQALRRNSHGTRRHQSPPQGNPQAMPVPRLSS